jgi:hypothetical protein
VNCGGEIGQKCYRIKDAGEYARDVECVWMNPVKAGMAAYLSARLRGEVELAPQQFLAKARG